MVEEKNQKGAGEGLWWSISHLLKLERLHNLLRIYSFTPADATHLVKQLQDGCAAEKADAVRSTLAGALETDGFCHLHRDKKISGCLKDVTSFY